MSRRSRAIADDLLLQERLQEQINASLERTARRERTAHRIAEEMYGSDDVVLADPDDAIESVDGGYWVSAQVWVDAEAVEERMGDD